MEAEYLRRTLQEERMLADFAKTTTLILQQMNNDDELVLYDGSKIVQLKGNSGNLNDGFSYFQATYYSKDLLYLLNVL